MPHRPQSAARETTSGTQQHQPLTARRHGERGAGSAGSTRPAKGSPGTDWRLDEHTRAVGREGVAAARRPPQSSQSRCLTSSGATVGGMTTVAERLGYPSDAKLLILNCAELGFCHAANVGVFEALREGIGTSASLMVPAPWSRESASRYRGDDVGVHLTLNSPSTSSTGGARSPRRPLYSTAMGVSLGR